MKPEYLIIISVWLSVWVNTWLVLNKHSEDQGYRRCQIDSSTILPEYMDGEYFEEFLFEY